MFAPEIGITSCGCRQYSEERTNVERCPFLIYNNLKSLRKKLIKKTWREHFPEPHV